MSDADSRNLPGPRLVHCRSATDYAALLEQGADPARQPGRVDYPVEIKRWRAFAEQAEQMAERWKQPP